MRIEFIYGQLIPKQYRILRTTVELVQALNTVFVNVPFDKMPIYFRGRCPFQVQLTEDFQTLIYVTDSLFVYSTGELYMSRELDIDKLVSDRVNIYKEMLYNCFEILHLPSGDEPNWYLIADRD